VETTILVVAIIFTVVVLILLPKYAKFIHTQPRIDIERRRQQEAEQNSKNNSESTEKDG
jgi:uncharacterized ion transporter superfamily protein YfcC